MNSRSSLILVLCLAAFTFSLRAQDAAAASPGISLFNKGDFAGAVAALKGTKNYIELTFLGIAYEKLGKEKDAGKAFDESFERGFWLMSDLLMQKPSIVDNKEPAPKGTAEARLKLLQQPIVFALATADKIRALKTDYSKKTDFKMTVGFLEGLDTLLKNGETIYSDADLSSKMKLTNLPSPSYSMAARQNRLEGNVTLLALLRADGTKVYAPLQSLDSELMESVYSAARDTRFQPATKDGHPVAVLAAIKYAFLRN